VWITAKPSGSCLNHVVPDLKATSPFGRTTSAMLGSIQRMASGANVAPAMLRTVS